VKCDLAKVVEERGRKGMKEWVKDRRDRKRVRRSMLEREEAGGEVAGGEEAGEAGEGEDTGEG
jgi:hypothetical protein